jgi:hypothetical protein
VRIGRRAGPEANIFVADSPNPYDLWERRIVDMLLLAGGIALTCYEAIFREASDWGILLIAGGMMGLVPMRSIDRAFRGRDGHGAETEER